MRQNADEKFLRVRSADKGIPEKDYAFDLEFFSEVVPEVWPRVLSEHLHDSLSSRPLLVFM
jgi:hypothetical protein